MRTVIRFYLWWQRAEIVLVALLVPGLIVESSIANGWVYAGGVLSASLPAVIGLLRGFFFETLTYVTARQAFILRRKQHWFGCGLMGLVSLVAIYVSAANNLGWVMAGHDLAGLFGTLGQVMGDGPLLHGYEFFLAVLLPVSVGAVALVPLDHFFQHAIEQDHLDNHALQVDERHMHRSAFLKAQRKQRKLIEQAYQNIAEDRAQDYIEQVRTGDLSFGTGQLPVPTAPPVNVLPAPAPVSVPSLPAAGGSSVWPANQPKP